MLGRRFAVGSFVAALAIGLGGCSWLIEHVSVSAWNPMVTGSYAECVRQSGGNGGTLELDNAMNFSACQEETGFILSIRFKF